MAKNSDEKFQFVFTKLDAMEAVAEIGRRLDLGRAFGEQVPVSAGAYRFDPVTEYWFPIWWPEWSHD